MDPYIQFLYPLRKTKCHFNRQCISQFDGRIQAIETEFAKLRKFPFLLYKYLCLVCESST